MSPHETPRLSSGRPTIRDVAAAVGVDPSLVSRVVSNDPKASASASTRQRILDAVEELGYQPSAVARGLRMARTWTVGLLIPDLTNPLYSEVVKGVEERATELGYGVVFGTHEEGSPEDTFSRLLMQGRVDGLLVASGVLEDKFLRDLSKRSNDRMVMVNRRVDGLKPSVIVDDEAGAVLATEHLLALGHSRVAGIFGPSKIDTSRRRRKGFDAAMESAGAYALAVEQKYWGAKAGLRAARELFENSSDVTAIFASTFLMGVGVLRAAREHGISVPDQVSVVALHDVDLADYLAPPLTTVKLPFSKMGRIAVESLVALVEGNVVSDVIVEDKPVMVVRESTTNPS